MPSLPASGYIENASRTVAEMKTSLESVRDMASVLPGGGARTELTIASGTVTPATRDHGGHFTIDTEGDAASDDLDTITYTNLPNGSIIRVYAENAARVVTLKHGNGGAGEMLLQDDTDFEFGSLDQWVEFQRVGTSWEEIDRFVAVDELATLDESTIVDADLIPVFDASTGTLKAITRSALAEAAREFGATHATTSGTSVEWTSIPDWCNEIQITLVGVSLSGDADSLAIQLGDSGGYETTGYNGGVQNATGANVAGHSASFLLNPVNAGGGNAWHGQITLRRYNGNGWSFEAQIQTTTGGGHHGNGTKILSATLDRVKLFVTGTPTDAFDNGSATAVYLP